MKFGDVLNLKTIDNAVPYVSVTNCKTGDKLHSCSYLIGNIIK